ncbi:unnamed protein product [Oikopleura dioica]|nr:unnamed protein product [Oikopleura dioica]
MWVVGGCDPNGFSCGSTVEFFNGEVWQIAPNHPHESIYGNLVLGDVNGLYTISSDDDWYSESEVYKFNGFSWTLLGKLSEAHSQSWDMNSGKIVNGYAYVGEDEIDKIKLSEDEYFSYSIGNDPDGNDFWLYYSPMILVEGPLCAA